MTAIPKIDWCDIPLKYLEIRNVLDGCRTIGELSEVTMVFLLEIGDEPGTQRTKELKKIFYPLYMAITGMDYETDKFKGI
ncbi:MAG TPA: hypothetical protein VFM69_13365 [Pricia sp.]|nr:hypothetical protein [Pricia sp.]